MNTGMFLLGVVFSGALITGIARLTMSANEAGGLVSAPSRPRAGDLPGQPFSPRVSARDSDFRQILPGFLVLAVLVGFYFLNWIPPVPLSMKFGGMYHQITKAGEVYELTFEKPPWYRVWRRSDDVFQGLDPAYCFTAVFAPVDLQTQIYHHWQYRPFTGGRGFATTDRIRLAILGGREGGYRSYTAKRRLSPGKWRVDVETADGRIIGRVAFRVEEAQGPREFETIAY
jgi:hypothetical protein